MIKLDLFQVNKDVIHYIIEIKDIKSHNLPIRHTKVFDKIPHTFMIKILIKVGIQGVYLNTTKTIYDKPITNIILHDEKLKALLLNSGIGQGCSLLPLLFSKLLGVLTTALK